MADSQNEHIDSEAILEEAADRLAELFLEQDPTDAKSKSNYHDQNAYTRKVPKN